MKEVEEGWKDKLWRIKEEMDNKRGK